MHSKMCVSADLVIDTGEGIVLIKRKNPPFQGCWCLPGGHVDLDESVEKGAVREAYEETGVRLRQKDLFLIGVYSEPKRDPRYRNVSVAFWAFYGGRIRAGSDAREVRVFPYDGIPKRLGFDHSRILADYLIFRGG